MITKPDLISSLSFVISSDGGIPYFVELWQRSGKSFRSKIVSLTSNTSVSVVSFIIKYFLLRSQRGGERGSWWRQDGHDDGNDQLRR